MNSYWISSTEKLDINNKIDNDYECDVCVVGAGICGLSTAYYLAKHGLKVVVVDKNGIGKKASGHTTAKITLQHGLIYDYLINSFGPDFAMGYYKANKQAISNIKKIIDSENIDCDFEYQNNYVFASKKDDLSKIKNEVKALNTLGENAQFLANCDLPCENYGAIKTENQAQFHPRKYMLGLARAINNYGGLIFTDALVSDVQKYDDEYVSVVNSYVIKSKYVVMASHYPFINFPGFYFSKMYQATSYAVAIEIDNNDFDGMYINTGEPTLSFRTAKYDDKKLLIIGGGNHKTGYSPESESFYGYVYLEKEVSKLFPGSKILYKWDTRDCVTLDKVPYIGEFSNFMPNMFVATGFNKWGMTSSNVAGSIIAGKILKKMHPCLSDENSGTFENSNDGNCSSSKLENNYNSSLNCLIDFSKNYEKVFDSSRFSPIKNRGEMKNMLGQVFKSFVSNRLKIPSEDLSAIENDNGGIIKINGSTVGIYKDADGQVFAVDPTCTHLGCLLTWNNVDKTWDCPCHGSRFDYRGKNLYDPAFKDLETYGVN